MPSSSWSSPSRIENDADEPRRAQHARHPRVIEQMQAVSHRESVERARQRPGGNVVDHRRRRCAPAARATPAPARLPPRRRRAPSPQPSSSSPHPVGPRPAFAIAASCRYVPRARLRLVTHSTRSRRVPECRDEKFLLLVSLAAEKSANPTAARRAGRGRTRSRAAPARGSAVEKTPLTRRAQVEARRQNT